MKKILLFILLGMIALQGCATYDANGIRIIKANDGKVKTGLLDN